MEATSQHISSATRRRSHWWQRALRLLGIGLVGLALVQMVTAIPQLYGLYSTVCTDDCRLTPNDAAALATLGITPGQYALVLILVLLPFALACAAVGGVIFWQSARVGTARPFAVFVAFTLTLSSLSILSMPFNELYVSWLAHRDLWSITVIGMHTLNQVILTVMLTLLPDGRLAPRWLVVPLTLLIVLGVGGAYVLPLLQPVSAPDPLRAQLIAVVWVVIALFIMGVQIVKYRHEADQQRRQIRWCAAGVALLTGGAVLRILIT
jgi:hypothetical protein